MVDTEKEFLNSNTKEFENKTKKKKKKNHQQQQLRYLFWPPFI